MHRFGGGSSAAAAQSVVMVYSHSCGPRLLNVCSLTGGTRTRESDGDDVAVAVRVSLSNLSPWMPWVTEAAADPVAQRARAREAELYWDQGSDYSYVLRHSETGAILGMFGLHRRVGPTAIEVGYWLHPGYLGRGYATRSVGVLTEVALGCGMLTASKSIPTRPIRRALRFPGGSVIGSIGSSRRWTCRKRAPTGTRSPRNACQRGRATAERLIRPAEPS
jgi:hypothetical protein